VLFLQVFGKAIHQHDVDLMLFSAPFQMMMDSQLSVEEVAMAFPSSGSAVSSAKSDRSASQQARTPLFDKRSTHVSRHTL
jgi:hypothetical protein